MSFINMDAVNVAQPLKAAHFQFPRARLLREEFSWCVTDYYAKAAASLDFEARGLVVTGKSRVGKTREIKNLVALFNDSDAAMPDGRPARIVHCILSGTVTWKDLGVKVLAALDYPLKGRRTQNYIWEMVLQQAKAMGVIGIHFDECQHVFAPNAASNRIFLDSFKALMKESRWPLMLILSGIPSLADYIDQEEQLAHLLRPVHFGEIQLDRSNEGDEESDLELLNMLAFALADEAEVDFEQLSTVDFFERLDFACASRWGLAIELIIDAFTRCRAGGETVCSIDHFVAAYAAASRIPRELSPFTASSYRDVVDPARLVKLLRED